MKISGEPLVEILETGREGHPVSSTRDANATPLEVQFKIKKLKEN